MGIFQEKCSLPKTNEDEVKCLNRPITNRKADIVIKSFPKNKNSDKNGFMSEFYQTFREDLVPLTL